MRALLVAALVLLCGGLEAHAELMRMTITPRDAVRIGGMSVREGVLVGNREDILRLGRAGVLDHSDCERYLLPAGSVPSDASILRPMTPVAGVQVPGGQIWLELPSIRISLPIAQNSARPFASQVVYELPASPPPPHNTVPPSRPPEPPRPVAATLDNDRLCKVDEACISRSGEFSGSIECAEVTLGISTEGKAEFGAGPVKIVVGAR